MIYVCPKPYVWHPTYMKLRKAWEVAGRKFPEPPIPLVLDGWHYSSDTDKKQRWEATLQWAKQYEQMGLIPSFAEEEIYFTDALSTSYPEQHYRPDRYVERDRPDTADIERVIPTLIRNWDKIAGDAIAAITKPLRITGAKARRLVVLALEGGLPPWGTWHSLSSGPERETFSAFRRRVNEAIAPVQVDHIDFVTSDEK
jgi:hypothetical protein